MSEMKQEMGVVPEGEHTAWSDPDGMRAEVRKGSKVVKRLKGESSWSNAVRKAGDLNAEARA